jgi:hypothetical protein
MLFAPPSSAGPVGYVRFVDLRRRLARFTSEQRGHSHLVAPLCSALFHPMVAISKELPEREPPSIQAVGAGSSCESPSQIISKASRASPIVKALRPMCHPWGQVIGRCPSPPILRRTRNETVPYCSRAIANHGRRQHFEPRKRGVGQAPKARDRRDEARDRRAWVPIERLRPGVFSINRLLYRACWRLSDRARRDIRARHCAGRRSAPRSRRTLRPGGAVADRPRYK